ncbi:MAG: phosphodiester glycosidase family protein [Bacillota bacterium]|nr:hypothetical protein [Bacillota bacterium]
MYGSEMFVYGARPHAVELVLPRRRRLLRARRLLATYPGPWRVAANAAYGNPLITCGVLARRGRLLAAYPLDWPALVVLNRGGAFIAEQPTRPLARAARIAVGGGPVLVRSGLPTDVSREIERLGLGDLAPGEPLARTAVGIRPDGTVILGAWRGATLEAAALDLIRVGVVHAMALEGDEGALLFSRRRGVEHPLLGRAERRVAALLVLRRARRIRSGGPAGGPAAGGPAGGPTGDPAAV